MVRGVTIQPDAFYDEPAVIDLIGVSAQSLSRARRARELRYSRKGKQTVYLGSWLLDWLTAEPAQEAVAR